MKNCPGPHADGNISFVLGNMRSSLSRPCHGLFPVVIIHNLKLIAPGVVSSEETSAHLGRAL